MTTKNKRYIALARVSSREQEREGYSLDVQEDALKRYAEREGGIIVKFWKIAETASKKDERKTFKELIAYAKKHCRELHGILFYKVDRAARNLFDYVELERLESDQGVPFISVSQPTENTPAGHMQRRILASMASYYTEQQALDVREGLARRVQEGWFAGTPPFGYRAIRKDGRSVVEVHPIHGPKIPRIYALFGDGQVTLDLLSDRLAELGMSYTDARTKFPASSLYRFLRDRAYLGEVSYHDQWHPGKHPPLVDRQSWDRVQARLGSKARHAHGLVFAGSLIHCGHCGKFITGESVTKKKSGKVYYYYRCTENTRMADHPRIRVTEADLDRQVFELFEQLKIGDEQQRNWFVEVLMARAQEGQQESQAHLAELRRQLALGKAQADALLNLRVRDEIDADTFAAKKTELRDREAKLTLLAEDCDGNEVEKAVFAAKVFELSQTLKEQWVAGDYACKRRMLETVCLNLRLDGASLIVDMRKPFDVLAKGLVLEDSRGDRTPVELFARAVADLDMAEQALLLSAVGGEPEPYRPTRPRFRAPCGGAANGHFPVSARHASAQAA